jgi:hypothetical protein
LVAAQETVRHERVATVIESTEPAGIVRADGDVDFSTDAAVARTRPGHTPGQLRSPE